MVVYDIMVGNLIAYFAVLHVYFAVFYFVDICLLGVLLVGVVVFLLLCLF